MQELEQQFSMFRSGCRQRQCLQNVPFMRRLLEKASRMRPPLAAGWGACTWPGTCPRPAAAAAPGTFTLRAAPPAGRPRQQLGHRRPAHRAPPQTCSRPRRGGLCRQCGARQGNNTTPQATATWTSRLSRRQPRGRSTTHPPRSSSWASSILSSLAFQGENSSILCWR